jgi:hypothetical protein
MAATAQSAIAVIGIDIGALCCRTVTCYRLVRGREGCGAPDLGLAWQPPRAK